MATRDGRAADDFGPLAQPAPGSGTPQPALDGREYWRRRALAAEAAVLELRRYVAALEGVK